jgi:hypothetical protein
MERDHTDAIANIRRALEDGGYDDCCGCIEVGYADLEAAMGRIVALEARLRTMRDAFAIIWDIADRLQVVEIARRFAEEVGDE